MLVTYEPVIVQARLNKIIDHFRGIYKIYLKLMKNKPEGKMSTTCKWLDLETPRSQLIMPKRLLGHCSMEVRRYGGYDILLACLFIW